VIQWMYDDCRKVALSIFLLQFIVSSSVADDLVSLSRVTFVTSPKWYILKNEALDGDVLMFRKYSFSVIDGKIAGAEKTKDILDFGCQRTSRYSDYVVFHFPNWTNNGISRADWKPRLPLQIGINGLSLTFNAEAEFKNGGLFVDLDDLHRLNLLKMMTAQSITVDYGVNDARLNLEQRTRASDGEGNVVNFVDDFVVHLVAPSVDAGKVTSYDMDKMLATCLAYKRKGTF
jgi:hypothetical protein